MGTINQKLDYLVETKEEIRKAIQEKGVAVSDSDTFRSYADKIGEIESVREGFTPTELYQIVQGIRSVRNKTDSNQERFMGYILSENAGEYAISTQAKFVNVSGKPMLFISGAKAGTEAPYGSVFVVSEDYVEGVDYRIDNGTKPSSEWSGWEYYNIYTPAKHNIRIYNTIWSNYTTDDTDLYWYMNGRTLQVSTQDVSLAFVNLKQEYVGNRIGILADYLIFGER